MKLAIITSRGLRACDVGTIRQYVNDLASGTVVITAGRAGGEMVAARTAMARGLEVQMIVPADRSKLDPEWTNFCTSFHEMPDGTSDVEHAIRLLDEAEALVIINRRPPEHPASWRGATSAIHRQANRRGMAYAMFVLEPEEGAAPYAVEPRTDEIVTLPCYIYLQTVYQPSPTLRVVMLSGEQSGYAVLVDGQLHIGKLANRCTWRAVRAEMMRVADTLLGDSLHEVA